MNARIYALLSGEWGHKKSLMLRQISHPCLTKKASNDTKIGTSPPSTLQMITLPAFVAARKGKQPATTCKIFSSLESLS